MMLWFPILLIVLFVALSFAIRVIRKGDEKPVQKYTERVIKPDERGRTSSPKDHPQL